MNFLIVFCSSRLHNNHPVPSACLYSVSWVSAGLDVEEFADKINLNASGDNDNEDLNKRPRSDVIVVLFKQRVISRFNCPWMRLELLAKKMKGLSLSPWNDKLNLRNVKVCFDFLNDLSKILKV